MKNDFIAIIQTRVASQRFYGKVLSKINNKTIIEIIVHRLKKSKNLKKIIIATTKNKQDDVIVDLAKKIKIDYFRGSEKNVLERYFFAAKKFKAQNIVRVTSDCPFVDYRILDNLISLYKKSNSDYVSNVIHPTFPDGLDLELMNFNLLKDRYYNSNSKNENEHVTINMINNKSYKKKNLSLKKNYSNLRLTLDNKTDLKIIKKIFKYFKNNFDLSYKDILSLYERNPNFFEENKNKIRNDQMKLNSGQKFWIRAKEVIPGGTMLFSKNPDLYLPKKWPAYFSKTKGCDLWDLDGKKFQDIFLMGLGTNILGYSNSLVDKNVKKAINNGNLSSLNSKDEIILAEKLLSINPWAESVRFTRSGGEANAVAIRIARAYSGKDNIAVCGYHGWHDWYLSANLNKTDNLNSHIIKDLKVSGVPKKLQNTVFPFEYNDLQQLKKIVKTKNIGTIKMEVERDNKPKNNFLKEVKKICKKNNIVLIFDECTSGFRETYGGLYLKYKVTPDICIFGKALGNGYAVNAIVGKKEIMNSINSTFISSTFWTERIGSVAALKTLEVMKQEKSWEKITKIGKFIKKNWQQIASSNNLKISIMGLDALPKFNFVNENHLAYKTYVSQEMLKKNILAANVIYVSTAHTKNNLLKYFDNLDRIFKIISKCDNQKENIYNLLETDVSIQGIRSKK